MRTVLVLSLALFSFTGCGGALYLNDPPDGGDLGHDGMLVATDGMHVDPPAPGLTVTSCTSTGKPTGMPVGLAYAGAAAGADGRIYVFGGAEQIEEANSAHAYAYDPATATWTSITDLPAAPMGGPAGVSIGRTIYSVADQLYAYDIDTGVWSTKTPLTPTAIYVVAAAGSDGKIYVAGGVGSLGGTVDPAVYDPSTDSWSPLPAPPYPEDEQTAAIVGGTLYMFGTQAAAFDIAGKKWANIPSPLTPSYTASGGVVGAKLIIAGGFAPNSTGEIATAETFDPSTSTWTNIAPLPVGTSEAPSATGCDGRFYVFGGDNGSLSTEVQAYDPSSNTWQLSP